MKTAPTLFETGYDGGFPAPERGDLERCLAPSRASLGGNPIPSRMRFENRTDAGRQLALAVAELLPLLQPDAEGRENRKTVVLAIPKGGIPVALPIARALYAPLDVWLAKKISAPENPEFAIGSVSINGEVFLDERLIRALRIPAGYVEAETKRRSAELEEEALAYRRHDAPLEVKGKNVVLVDDGIATGATALAALASLRRAGAARRVLAVPVAPLETVARLELVADELVALQTPLHFSAVGAYYENFSQLSLKEAADLLVVYNGAY